MAPIFTMARNLTTLAAVVLALLSAGGAPAMAQRSTTFGRHFLIAFPDTAQSHVREPFNTMAPEATLTLYSLDTATVTITGPGFSRGLTVYPGRASVVSVMQGMDPRERVFIDVVDTAMRRTYEVRSDKPVAVTAYFVTIYGAESFTPLPVERWGREYFAATLDHQFIFHALAYEEKYTYVFAPGELVIVAAVDGTQVTIEATSEILGADRRTIVLNAGEAYLIETAPPQRPDSLVFRDLSGTRITSTQPIGVLSGNTRTLGSRDNPLPLDPLPTNSMSNSAVDWLAPVELHGTTFIYRQHSAIDELRTSELIRVYGTSPGTTIVTTTNGPPMSVAQGSFLEFNSRLWRTGGELQPFAIRTDRPAQAFVWSASLARLLPESAPGTELETHSWSPAMTELTPRERWISFGMVNSPSYPAGTDHYLIIAADSGAIVTLDGARVDFEAPVIGTSYQQARVKVLPGDHLLRSTGGRFAATAYGQRRGYAAFRPLKARRDDEPSAGVTGAGPLHISVYLEILAISYAMPVPGVYELTPPQDSLVITRDERCDSSVVLANRLSPSWSSGILTAELDPSSVNVDAVITPTFAVNLHVGYRIRFMPRDPAQDADGAVILRNDAGQTWRIPYSYRASTVSVTPLPIDLLAVPAGTERTVTLTITNQKPFTTTVLAMHFRFGDQGFSFRPANAVPKALASGQSFTVTLAFTGPEPGRHYLDSLVVLSVCDSVTIPLSARTAPVAQEPVPLISGYDWRERRVGSANDTLSFISNAGSRSFAPSDVSIAGRDPAAFALVAPDWRTIADVPPGERFPIGIRFTPPAEGEFLAEIVLTTADGTRVSAPLRGVGVASHVSIGEADVGTLCIGAEREVLLTLTTTGLLPVRVDSLTVSTSGPATATLDTAGLWLPKVLTPGGWLPIRIQVRGAGVGTIDVTLIAHTDAVGDSLGAVTGAVVPCGDPWLEVTDHDFDTVYVTLTRNGTVAAINRGTEPVTIETMRITDDVGGVFRLVSPTAPLLVRPGDSIPISVDFTPSAPGPYSARITYTTTVGTLYSNLHGVGASGVVPIGIPRTYHGEPGTEQTFVVQLYDTLEDYRLDTLTVRYDPELLDYLGGAGVSSALEVTSIDARRGVLGIAVRQATSRLDPGDLIALRFLVRISPIDSSELPVEVRSTVPWLTFIERPGLFRRDPWCGIQERMFEWVVGSFYLRAVMPDPVENDAVVEFGLIFEHHTQVVVYDALGREALRLVDGPLGAGSHSVPLPAGTLESGIYTLRLTSGGSVREARFVVRK